MRWRVIASSAAKGSSINRSRGPSATTYANATRFRWPPLSARGERWPNPASPSLPSHASASSRAWGRGLYHCREKASWIVLARRRPPLALVLADPGQHPAAEFRALRLETGRPPGFLSALPGQRVAPGFRSARHPDPDDAAQGQEPLRRALIEPPAPTAPARGGLPAISYDPCKSGKTGRIIDSALRFAPVILDKTMQIRYLTNTARRGRTGVHFRRSGRPNRAIRGLAGWVRCL